MKLDHILYFFFKKRDNKRDNFQKYIFRDITTTKLYSIINTHDNRISYICVSENILEELKKIRADIKFFNLHSP